MDWKLYGKYLKRVSFVGITAWKSIPRSLCDVWGVVKGAIVPLIELFAVIVLPFLFILYPFIALWAMREHQKIVKQNEEYVAEIEKSRNYHRQVKDGNNE